MSGRILAGAAAPKLKCRISCDHTEEDIWYRHLRKEVTIFFKGAGNCSTQRSKKGESDMEKRAKYEKESKKQDIKKEGGIAEVVFIIDRSGSMTGLEADTIGGFNSTLKEQRESSDNVIWSTVLFDHEQEVIHDRVPIDEVSELTRDEYYVRGTTALLDAVGGAIHHIGNVHKYARPEDRPARTLFVITTDGMENSSRRYTYEKVKHMIERQQKRYDWEFLFMGANIDAVSVAGRMGIPAMRAATYINDEIGIQTNYRVVKEAVRRTASMEDLGDELMCEIREDYIRRGGKK